MRFKSPSSVTKFLMTLALKGSNSYNLCICNNEFTKYSLIQLRRLMGCKHAAGISDALAAKLYHLSQVLSGKDTPQVFIRQQMDNLLDYFLHVFMYLYGKGEM